MKDQPKLKDMFSCTAEFSGAADAAVVSVVANKDKQTLSITLQTPVPIAPIVLNMCEAAIKNVMKLKQVTVSAAAPPAVKKNGKKQAGELILGDKPIKGTAMSMAELIP
ncbi:MAG: hypothetical protein LBT88_03470, partial [Oscillospiraceae bacterium]|nr:hypothetical protein [Oscillospiraceae bacterium]